MRETANPSEACLVCICVDARINGDISGRVYHCGAPGPLPFMGAQRLLLDLDRLFDRQSLPQAVTRLRSFDTRRTARKAVEGGIKMDVDKVTSQKGGKGTFVVRVQFRQNATWQGTLLWGEKNKAQQFRSALELLKLMDSALCEDERESGEAPAENQTE